MKREFSPTTTLFCLIGDPVSHSKSPAMMNAAFETLGMDSVYLAFCVPEKEVGTVLNALSVMNVEGINVTAPHKDRVIAYLDEISPDALISGAVNTIVKSRWKFIGHNTDGIGLISAIKDELLVAVSDARILIIGAGGAARGVVFSILKEKPASLTIANRSFDKADLLSSDLKKELKGNIEIDAVPLDPEAINPDIDQFDIIINATSISKATPKDISNDISQGDDFFGLDLFQMKKRALFYDMNYGMGRDDIEGAFKKNGILYSNGLTMLLHQGAHALYLWTGETPPIDIMRAALGLKKP